MNFDEKFFCLPEYTRDEVREKGSDSNWIIINDFVYDLTDFLRIHPGGMEVLLEYSGLDATSVFEDVGHSAMARGVMLRYVIGRLANTTSTTKHVYGHYRRRSSAAAVSLSAATSAVVKSTTGVNLSQENMRPVATVAGGMD